MDGLDCADILSDFVGLAKMCRTDRFCPVAESRSSAVAGTATGVSAAAVAQSRISSGYNEAKCASAARCGSKPTPYMSCISGMALTSSISLRGIGFAAALQVGIEEEIHGVELVAFAAHVHGRGLARGGDRGQVRFDVVLPQADARENVRWHMQGVRRGGRDLRVAARRGNARLRQLRLVVTVNQVMRDAGMIGLGREELFEDRGRLLAVRERRVLVWLGGEQRKRVERRGFVIVGIVTYTFFIASE